MVKKNVFLIAAVLVAMLLAVFPGSAQAAPLPQTAPTVAKDGVKIWCMPKGTIFTSEQLKTDVMPKNAKQMRATDKALIVPSVNDACWFVVTFSAAMPEGAQIWFYDNSNALWLKAPLVAGTEKNTGFAALRHGYIIDPPFWSITYTLKVVTKDGAELWSSPVVFQRPYEPGKCFDGKWPDPVTWYCYYPPDAHPWDPWYKYVNPTP